MLKLSNCYAVFWQNYHLNRLLMGHSKYFAILFPKKTGSTFGNLTLMKGIWNCYFPPNFDAFFSLNLLSWAVKCQWISCVSYGFRDKVAQKWPTSAELQNLNFYIYHPILMQIFFLSKIIIFSFLKGFKNILQLYFAYMEGIFIHPIFNA
jgi:hypothetical protein